MKHAFAILLCIHGIIHLMGYAKAFYLNDIQQQILGISKPIGFLWLVTFILFIVTAIQFLTYKKWFYLALIVVAVSQILIIMAWKDARFGTIPNFIILVVSIASLSTYRFHAMIDNESTQILYNATRSTHNNISKNNFKDLPEIVKKWMQNSGATDHIKVSSVRLKQQGEMRMKSTSKWMSFKADQYFDVTHASFVWKTNVNENHVVNMVGRDKLLKGEGAMLIKLFGMFPVVNESKNYQINSGAMIRYLAETCWFPSAALHDYITWEGIDDTSARATFKQNDLSVSGVFSFNTEGDLVSFKAERYYGGSEDAKLENWYVEMVSYKTFHGIRIPNKSKVTWQLENSDFHWLTIEITDLDYNPIQLFQ